MWSLMGICQRIFCRLLASCQGDSQEARSIIKCSVNKLGSVKVICVVHLTGAPRSGLAVQSEVKCTDVCHLLPRPACKSFLCETLLVSGLCYASPWESPNPLIAYPMQHRIWPSLCKRKTETLCLGDPSCLTKQRKGGFSHWEPLPPILLCEER